MSKSKEEVRKAIRLLRELQLDPEHVDALDIVERHSGELRRQIAELKNELIQSRGSVCGIEKGLMELHTLRLLKSELEEKIRRLEGDSNVMKSQLAKFRQQVPRPLPATPDVMEAALLLSKQTRGVYSTALAGWDAKLAQNVLLQYAVLLVLKATQVMASQSKTDVGLEEEILIACQEYFDRVAPGTFSYTKREPA